MGNNFIYIILLIIFDNISAIPPTNSEFWFAKHFQNHQNNNKKWFQTFFYYYSIYMSASIVGGFISYAIGYFFSHKILNFFNLLFSLVFGKSESFFSNILTSYDPLKILLLKSFTPGLPVSIFNTLCGINNSSIFKFLLVTIVFRTVRFLSLSFFKRYLKYKFIKNTLQITAQIICYSSCILLIYSTYAIFENNFFSVV